MSKKIIVVTGGAGFIGSNLIHEFINRKIYKKYNIISIDDYSSGKVSNHIKNKNIKYIKSNTNKIEKVLEKYKKKIKVIFHFGEFSRIYQSFIKFNQCLNSNVLGSKAVFNFCLKNKIKLVYSATSASLGNNGKDKDLSPYAFTKSKNLEFLENLRKWFKFKFEVIYFFNVYGKNQIENGDMATVIGIFERQYRENKPITVVKPGSQTRRFTYINDTINICIEAWKKNKCKHYSISSKETFSIKQIAEMFGGRIKFLPPRKGERYASVLTKMNLNKNVILRVGKSKISDYIKNITKK